MFKPPGEVSPAARILRKNNVCPKVLPSQLWSCAKFNASSVWKVFGWACTEKKTQDLDHFLITRILNIGDQAIAKTHSRFEITLLYPQNKKSRDFFWPLNFFQSFLPHAALLLQPLTNLTKKALLVWGKEQQNFLNQAQEALLHSIILKYLSTSAQVRLNTDASGTCIGATLMQRESQDRPWAPILFYSKGSTLPNGSIQRMTGCS